MLTEEKPAVDSINVDTKSGAIMTLRKLCGNWN